MQWGWGDAITVKPSKRSAHIGTAATRSTIRLAASQRDAAVASEKEEDFDTADATRGQQAAAAPGARRRAPPRVAALLQVGEQVGRRRDGPDTIEFCVFHNGLTLLANRASILRCEHPSTATLCSGSAGQAGP